MGMIHADIILTHEGDLYETSAGRPPPRIRREQVRALVDTGALQLTISPDLQSLLELPVVRKVRSVLANGQRQEVDLVGPVRVEFGNRVTTVHALVLPGSEETLLGAIPLEGMDVLIDPTNQRLIMNPASPDMATYRVYQISFTTNPQ